MIPFQLKAARLEIAVLRLLLKEVWGLLLVSMGPYYVKEHPALAKKIGAVLKTGTDR